MGIKRIKFRGVVYATVAAFIAVILVVGGLAYFEINRITTPLVTTLPQAIAAFSNASYQNDLSRLVLFYDEVLTQSARNYAFTQDKKWESRYFATEPELDNCIMKAISAGGEEDGHLFGSVDSANKSLHIMEHRSIAYVDSGKSPKARYLLDDAEYWRQKEIYKKGLVDYSTERGYSLKEANHISDAAMKNALNSEEATAASARMWVMLATIFALLAACSMGILGIRFAKAEEKLRENEERFKAMYEGSNDAIMLLTEKGFFDCNARTLEMFGFTSKEEFIKVHPADISPPNQPDGTESFPAAMERIKTAFEKGSNRFEWVHSRSSGENFSAEVLLSAFTLKGKRVVQATVRDISERKQAAEALRRNEAMLRGIYSAAPVGISVSHDSIMTRVNGGLCEITGYSPEELTGKTTRICFADDEEFERVGREWYGNNNREVRKNIEARWRRKDGVIIDVLINKAPMDTNDPMAGNVISVLDITKQKQTQQALVESEKSFRGMFEMTSEGVGLISPRTNRFIAANPGLCVMFGYTEEEFCILTPDDLTPPVSKEVMRQSVETYFRLGYVPDHEETSFRKDGSRIHSIIGSRQLTWKGESVGFITYKNITSLKEAQEKLKKKNAEILEFTNMITHDLKKPLTVMKTICSLAKMNATASGDIEFLEAAKIGSESVLYMQEMLDDLLVSAKLESWTADLALEEFSFKEAVGQVIQRLKLPMEEKKIRMEMCENDVRIRADAKQLGRLLMNLVGNAINYIGDKPEKHINIGWEQKDGQTIFVVQDNGIGIPQETQSHLFTKFKRGVNVSGISGTGLGLSIVKGIVLAHGGKIWFESKEGEGTAFHFTLG